MAYFTTVTQMMYSFTSSFQSEWRPTDSSSIHPSLSFYWCRCLLDYSTFALGDTEVRPADTIVTLESTLTADSRCMWVNSFEAAACLSTALDKNHPQIHYDLSRVILVNSFIVFRVDYHNSILACQQTCQLDRIQSVLITPLPVSLPGWTPSDHATDMLRDNLHWFRVPSGSLIALYAMLDHV